MKIAVILRGFPGLGRVVSGMEITRYIREQNEIYPKIFTYLKGREYARVYNQKIDSYIPSEKDISSIGIIPVSRYGEYILSYLKDNGIGLAIIDGEPLMIEAIKLYIPECKILALLNPSDLYNKAYIPSSERYFTHLYNMSDIVFVHGIEANGSGRCGNTETHHAHTIIRDEVLGIKKNCVEGNDIYCILGGGTSNMADDFVMSTLSIADKCVSIALKMAEFNFNILCSDIAIYDFLYEKYNGNLPNVSFHKNICNVDYYNKASFIITRSGRNTLSELLYLEIPAIVFCSGGTFRLNEQQENAEHVQKHTSNIAYCSIDTPNEELIEFVLKRIDEYDCCSKKWVPGNKDFYTLLDSIINNSNSL